VNTNYDVNVFKEIVDVNLDNGVECSKRAFMGIQIMIWMY
jgi:hypothetical protein